jgi:hypothetical protein
MKNASQDTLQTVEEIAACLEKTLPIFAKEKFILSPNRDLDISPYTSRKKQPRLQPLSQNPTYNRHQNRNLHQSMNISPSKNLSFQHDTSIPSIRFSQQMSPTSVNTVPEYVLV